MRKIEIEREHYDGPYGSPALAKRTKSSLRCLSGGEAVELKKKQIEPELRGTSKYVPEAGHLNYLLREYSNGANAYYAQIEGRTLTIKFYEE